MQFYVHCVRVKIPLNTNIQYAAENANTQYYGVYPKQVTF